MFTSATLYANPVNKNVRIHHWTERFKRLKLFTPWHLFVLKCRCNYFDIDFMASLKMRSDGAQMHHEYQKVWSFNSIAFASDSWPQIKITKNDVEVKPKCSRKKTRKSRISTLFIKLMELTKKNIKSVIFIFQTYIEKQKHTIPLLLPIQCSEKVIVCLEHILILPFTVTVTLSVLETLSTFW